MTPDEIQLATHYFLKVILDLPLTYYGGVHSDLMTLEWYHPTIPAPTITDLNTLLPAAQEWADQRQEKIRKKSTESLVAVNTNATTYQSALTLNLVVRESAIIDIRCSAIFWGDSVANRTGQCRLRIMPGAILIGSELEIDSAGKIAAIFSEMIRLQPDNYQLQLQYRGSNADYFVHLKNMHLSAYLLRGS